MIKNGILKCLSLAIVLAFVVSAAIMPVSAQQATDMSSPMPKNSSSAASTTTSSGLDKPSAMPSAKADTPKAQKSTSGKLLYYGSQLKTPQEIQLYNALGKNMLTDSYATNSGTVIFNTPIPLNTKSGYISGSHITTQASYHLQRALDAFRFDHPEIYWITGGSVITGIDLGTSKNGQLIILGAQGAFEPLVSNYSSDNAKIDAAVNEILAVAMTKTNHYDRLKVVHDMLAEKIDYKEDQDPGGRGHQISGGLVDGKGVCETYSKSFKLIADLLGYDCILVGGTGNVKNEKISHMWNYIKIDGNWYAVDVTWDDQSKTIHDYFLVGSETVAPNFGGTFFSTHIEEHTFHPVEYAPFVYPKLSKTAYPKPQ